MQRIRPAFFTAIVLTALLLAAAGCGDDQSRQDVPAGGEIAPRFSEDVRMYEQALASDPNNMDILVQLGNKHFDWGEYEARTLGDKAQPGPKWEKGIEYYKRALAIDPNNVNVRTDMGTLMNWLGRYDEAAKEYRTSMKMSPTHPQSRINLIVMLGGAMGRYSDAVKEYEALLKVVPEQKDNLALKEEVDRYRQAIKEAGK